MITAKPTKLRIVALVLFIVSAVYIGTLAFVTRSALYPRWYKPGISSGANRALAPCSEYQKKTYLYCGNPRSDFNLEFEDVVATRQISQRTVAMSGWFITASGPTQGVVVLVHGGGADRRAMLKHVPYLHKAGFDTLVMDCQNHGMAPNDGRGISFGRYESESVLAAVDWLSAKNPSRPIAVMGTSQGAVSVLLAAGKSAAIKSVVAENPFYSLARVLNDVPLLQWVPHFFREHAVATLSFWHGADFFELKGSVFGPRVSQPVLLIHGAEDHIVPYNHSEQLMGDLASKDKEFWLVPYGDHELLWNRAPEEYERRVLAFIQHAIAGGTARSTPFQGTVK